ncbi:MAG: flavin reductase, partial [Ruminococcus sp.]|nr:flavin reductase [Ruminococcus sp.]
VAINKANYSHDVIKKTGFMNVNCLTEEASFDIFRQFGFKSGRDTDKFEGEQVFHTANGAAILTKFINSFISLKVTDYIDTGSHGLFICELTDAAVINDKPSMTYAFYHANVKPKPQPKKTKGFVCKICGYIYEGETLPEDYVCPICKHPASDFEPIE